MQLLYLSFVILNVNLILCEDPIESEELLIDIDLPEDHLAQYFNNLPEFAKKINESSNEPYKEFLSSEKFNKETCWGYEINCKKPLMTHKCLGNHTGYVQSKEAQLDVFYAQADFGEVKIFQGQKKNLTLHLLKVT